MVDGHIGIAGATALCSAGDAHLPPRPTSMCLLVRRRRWTWNKSLRCELANLWSGWGPHSITSGPGSIQTQSCRSHSPGCAVVVPGILWSLWEGAEAAAGRGWRQLGTMILQQGGSPPPGDATDQMPGSRVSWHCQQGRGTGQVGGSQSRHPCSRFQGRLGPGLQG